MHQLICDEKQNNQSTETNQPFLKKNTQDRRSATTYLSAFIEKE
jgi:hypothetical protein